jgi:hypothetical protein
MDHDEKELLRLIELDLAIIIDLLQRYIPPKADKLTGTLVPQGALPMLSKTEAPMTVTVGQTGTTLIVETAKGVVVPTTGPIAYGSDNPAVCVYNPDGTWKALAAGVANLSQLDTTLGLTDSTQVTVQAAAPPVADTLTGTLVPDAAKK